MSDENLLGGYRPDVPDARDYGFAQLRAKLALAAPGIDPFIIPMKRSPRSQVGESCVANAWARGIEIIADLARIELPDLAAQHLYWTSRQRHGEQKVNKGTFLRTAATAAVETGIPSEEVWPARLDTIGDQPPPQSFVDAYDARLDAYHRISADDAMLDSIEQAVRSLRPVAFGVMVSPEFVRYDGSLMVFGPPERILGGHAMLVVGVEGVGDDRVWTWLTSWGAFGIDGRGLVRCNSAYMRQSIDVWVGTASLG